jgi:hypothetical protein
MHRRINLNQILQIEQIVRGESQLAPGRRKILQLNELE